MSHFFESIFNVEQIILNPQIALEIIKSSNNSSLGKDDTRRLCEEGFLLKAVQSLSFNSPENISFLKEIVDSLDKEELAKSICDSNKKAQFFSSNYSFKTQQKSFNLIERIVDVGIVSEDILNIISQEKDAVQLSKYLDNALSYDKNQINESNVLYFLHHISTTDWENLKSKHPSMIDDFAQLKIRKNGASTNVLQEAAQFNPALYKGIKKDFPNLSLSENDPNFLQKINNQDIFIEEFKKNEKVYKLNGKMFYIHHSRYILDECLKTKKVEDFDSYETRSAGAFIATCFDKIFSNIINHPSEEVDELNKYQSVALEMLKLNDNDYIETFLFNITQHPNQLIKFGTYMNNMSGPIKMLDKFDEHFSKNQHIKTVSLRNSIGDTEHSNSEISLNKEFMERLFQVQGLEIKKMNSINENPLAVLWGSANYYLKEKKEKSAQKAIDALPLIQNFAIKQGHKYVFECYSDAENLTVTVLDKTKAPEGVGFSSRIITKVSDPRGILVTASLMNDFEFTNFMQKPLIFLNMLYNEEDKEIAQKIIVDRAKDMALLDCMPDEHKEKNLFAILKLYTNKQLFQDGKLAMILQKTKSNLNDFIFCNESNNFLYDTINEDLSPYGFEYNNPKVLHSFIVNGGTPFLDLIDKKINNSSYRCPKSGDTSLHTFIKQSGDHQCIQEIISIYPELASVTNKQGKFPIHSAISKLKICKEGSDAFKNSASIIRKLITLDYGNNKDEIQNLISACQDISPKMNKVVPFWKEVMDEKIILAAIRNANNELDENKIESNNDWKL